jgi:hypothetical protein
MSMFDQNLIIGLVVIAVVVMAVYSYAPQLIRRFMPGSGLAESFANKSSGASPTKPGPGKILGSMNAATAVGTSGSGMSGTGAAALSGAHSVVPSKSSGSPPPAAAAAKSSGADTFADYQGSLSDTMGSVPMNAIKKPQDCFPREQMNPLDLLPQDLNSQWAQVNPTGAGDIQGKNFLSAGALIGVNTVGQSLRNANYQLRSEPANPQVNVSPWMQSTIEPDLNRRPIE